MIIDVHQHYIALPPTMSEKSLTGWLERVASGFSSAHGRAARSERVDVSPEEIRDRLAASLPDNDGTKLRQRMNEAGVDVSIICVTDNIARGASDEETMAMNRQCAEVAKNSDGRLIALASVDPRRPAAPSLFRHCIQVYGMRGLKWHPDYGFYPNSEESYAVLKVAAELGVPLLTHTGPLATGAMPGLPAGQVPRAKYAHPALLDEVAQDLPDLKIVAAHMGAHQAWQEWAALAQCRPNLCGDLAMWQIYAVTHYERFCRELREILDIAGPDSVLFGSDDPFLTALVPNTSFIQIIKDLPRNAPHGLSFSLEEVHAILGGNAAKVFGI